MLICIISEFISTELFAQSKWLWIDAAEKHGTITLLLIGDTNIQLQERLS